MNKKPSGSFYRHILRDAWSVTVRGRLLWIFGFFASFLGVGGVYELLIQGTGQLGLRQDFGGYATIYGLLPSGGEIWRALSSLDGYSMATILLLALGVIMLGAVALWVVVSSQGALIAGIRDKSKAKKLDFSSDFNAGGEVFWPLLGLNAFSRIAITAVFYLLLSVLILLLADPSLLNSLLYLLAFLLLVPLTLTIGFVTVFAAGYVTLYRMRLVEAAESALALFRNYWLISVETAVILFAVNVAAAFALLLLRGVFGLLILASSGFLLASSSAAPIIVLVGGSVLGVILLILVSAGLATFQYATWTLLFLKLNQRGHGGIAKIVRLFNRIFGS